MLEASSQATGSKYSRTVGKRLFSFGPLSNMSQELREDYPRASVNSSLNRWLVESSSHIVIDSEQLHLTDLQIDPK